MKIYGLTGGIAAGKSAASARFIEKGIPVIDSDALGHTVIEPGGPAFDGVFEAFGNEILSDGKIDRAKLGDIVFADAEALKRLGQLVHPAVLSETARLCAQYAQEGHGITLIEAALHAEDGTLRAGLDGLILICCPDETRVQRLVEHRGLSESDALARLQSQTPPEKKMALSRWIVHNDSTIEHLHEQIDAILEEW
ncbi:dephospho-CoA kinase [bacterium AH-315-P07]|nr:dephospho-CoA kinase [bacterium AH-315-P07]